MPQSNEVLDNGPNLSRPTDIVPGPDKPPFIGDEEAQRSSCPSVRQGAKRFLLDMVDKGWFGLTPLQTHVVICGFPRSGTTLLLMIAETCVSDAKVFGRERQALWMAQHPFRNHSLMITKVPNDVFRISEIRAWYAQRPPSPRFVITMRDPRSVLTSLHARLGNQEYMVTPDIWRVTYEHIQYACQFDDVHMVRFEDLVQSPMQVQDELTKFIGWQVHHPFADFDKAVPAGWRKPRILAGANLNGLRPLDPATISKWRDPKHQERISALLREMPELPEYLIELGYETDKEWTHDYR